MANNFRGLICYRHGNMQANMVLEKELKVLHVDLQATGVCLTRLGLSIHETSKNVSTVTYFFQQGHTYSNNSMPPNSATPYGQDFKHMGTIQTITHTIKDFLPLILSVSLSFPLEPSGESTHSAQI